VDWPGWRQLKALESGCSSFATARLEILNLGALALVVCHASIVG
jgi:hypothetical protein